MNREKRRHRRYAVEGICGNVLYTSDIEVLNVSIEGIALETQRRLELNREYSFKIRHKDAVLSLKGRVVWSTLISKEKKGMRAPIPVYRAGVRFPGSLSEKATDLIKFIEQNKLESFDNRVGVRFKLDSAKNIKIAIPQTYKIKKIGLSGMLAETEYPLDLDSVYDIEIIADESLINIMGKVTRCEKILSNNSVKYGIGFEFVRMSEENYMLLKDFLEALKDA
ncbi:MAG: PilZ domain-containing protein [Nitrospirota bacterium]